MLTAQVAFWTIQKKTALNPCSVALETHQQYTRTKSCAKPSPSKGHTAISRVGGWVLAQWGQIPYMYPSSITGLLRTKRLGELPTHLLDMCLNHVTYLERSHSTKPSDFCLWPPVNKSVFSCLHLDPDRKRCAKRGLYFIFLLMLSTHTTEPEVGYRARSGLQWKVF